MQISIGGVQEEDYALRVIVGAIRNAKFAVYHRSKDEVVCYICRGRGKATSSYCGQARQYQSSSRNANLVSGHHQGLGIETDQLKC